MAEAEASAGAPQAKTPVLLILVVAVVAMAGGAGGAYFVASRLPVPAPAAAGDAGGSGEPAAAAGGEAGEADPAAEFQQRLLSLDPMVVNITGDGYSRLLKIRVELECDSEATRDEAEARIPQLRDSIVTLVSSKRLADVTGFDGKALLKEDLRVRMNQLLSSGRVDSVLFTEFVVQ